MVFVKVSCEASVWNSVFFLLVTVRQVPLTAIESPIDKLNGLIFLQLIDKTYSPVFNLLMLEIFPTSSIIPVNKAKSSVQRNTTVPFKKFIY